MINLVEFLAERVHERVRNYYHELGVFNNPNDIPYDDLPEDSKNRRREEVKAVLQGMVEYFKQII